MHTRYIKNAYAYHIFKIIKKIIFFNIFRYFTHKSALVKTLKNIFSLPQLYYANCIEK